MYTIKSRRLRSKIMSFLYFSSFIFKENHVSDEEDSPSQKVVEELNDIDINETGNLKDLPTLVII